MLNDYTHTRTQRAIDTPFDNSSNGFASQDVQSAIEEAAVGAIQFQQVKAYVVGSSVIYHTYDTLISMNFDNLTNGVYP